MAVGKPTTSAVPTGLGKGLVPLPLPGVDRGRAGESIPRLTTGGLTTESAPIKGSFEVDWVAQGAIATATPSRPETGVSQFPSPKSVTVEATKGKTKLEGFPFDVLTYSTRREAFRLPPPVPGGGQVRIAVVTQHRATGVKQHPVIGPLPHVGRPETLDVITPQQFGELFGEEKLQKVLQLELGPRVTRSQLVEGGQLLTAALLFPSQIGRPATTPLAAALVSLGQAKTGGLPAGLGKGVPPPPLLGNPTDP